MFDAVRYKLIKWLTKDSRITSLLSSAAPGGVVWTPDRYEKYAEEVYLKNVIGYRCIEEIARGVASVPWAVFKTVNNKIENITDTHVLGGILRRPNPQDSWPFLLLKMTSYLALDGNVFLERICPLTGVNKGLPIELWAHRPDRIQILVGSDGKLQGYRYTVAGQWKEWLVDTVTMQADLLHIKMFHPLNDWWGMSAVKPAAREIDTSNSATEWNFSLLQNSGKAGMVFILERALTDEQFKRFESRLNDRYSGASNAGRNLLLEGTKGEVKPYGFSPAEMDYIEGNREVARRIALAWGVPPMLLGIPGDNTYSNYKEARLAFYEGTVLFYLTLIRDEINNWLPGSDEEVMLNWIEDKIPALSIRRDELWDKAQKSEFLTINEKRQMVGMDERPEGDVILTPATMLPLGEEIVPPADTTTSGKFDDEGIE